MATEQQIPKLVASPVEQASYPGWVMKHFTSDLETEISTGIESPQLWLHDRQKAGKSITGNKIYAFLLPDQETYRAKEGDLIWQCVSLADIQFYEKYPHRIPLEWKGKLIYAWKSVVLDGYGYRDVPCLNCAVRRPCVRWFRLDCGWGDGGPACFSAS